MSGYTDGRRVEYAVIAHLKAEGYDTSRGASSKGIADVIAIKLGQVLLVSCKRTTPPGPAERANLLRVAACLPHVAIALIALHPARQPLTFRRLTGPGPHDWQPWVADEITSYHLPPVYGTRP